jgi:DUF2934 family protein
MKGRAETLGAATDLISRRILMKYSSDRDGKSKTASAVDQKHYPEQDEAETPRSNMNGRPTHEQIAERAFQLWNARGCPDGSAEQDWLRAEAELAANLAPAHHTKFERSGSGASNLRIAGI